jgi:hypothetical protein
LQHINMKHFEFYKILGLRKIKMCYYLTREVYSAYQKVRTIWENNIFIR